LRDERDAPPGLDAAPPGRRRTGAVLLLALVLLIVAGLGWHVLRGRGDRVQAILADLGVWATMSAGRRWSRGDFGPGLAERSRMALAARRRSARGLVG
jgi:hypothetical protein